MKVRNLTIKLSVAIITLNEEQKLPKCLMSVIDIADEVIVVDSGSSDRTVSIAKKYGAKVYCHRFENYASQKNFALSKTSGEWILSMDADEEIEPKLALEIKRVIWGRENKFIAFSIPRKNIILGKLIKYSRWQPELDRHVWLWKKGYGYWYGNVHEEVIVNGEIGKLRSAKIHHQYNTLKEFFIMINKYSELEACQKICNNTKFSYFHLIIDPLYNFIVRYFYRLGFMDGWRGFVLSYMMGIYHLIIWIKVWEKR